MDDDHVRPLLEDDDQPSWVTLQGSDDRSTAGSTQSAWDRLAAAAKKSNRSAKNGGGNRQEKSSDDGLPRIILFMRLGNLAAAGLVIFGSVGALTKIFSPSKMVMGWYGVCFGLLVCCLEVNLSFLRKRIADNFGFLFNSVFRLLFYCLMAMVTHSFESILGNVASISLGVLALVNTYVICKYPDYRQAMKELSDEDERKMKKEARKAAWKHATGSPWWEV